MTQQHYVLATKLVPPRVKAQCLRRERLDELFTRVIEYPLTIIQADAGYGKSTALVTHLCSLFDAVAWYSVEETEREPYSFLQYLIHALKRIDDGIGDKSLRLLEEGKRTASVFQVSLTLLLNDLAERAPDPLVIVLDDLHTVADVQEIQHMLDLFIRYLPSHVHVVIGTRKSLPFSTIKRLHTTFDVLSIGKADLQFTADEIGRLFEQAYGRSLPRDHVHELLEQTEGWIIALQMIWKGLERGAEWGELRRVQPETDGRLFHYLAEEVFDRQPQVVQTFLERSCILETMEEEICNLLTGREDSVEILLQLEQYGLFVTSAGGGQYRYHRLFQQFLRNHAQAVLSAAEWAELHRKAATFYGERGDLQQALPHYADGDDLPALVDLLVGRGHDLMKNGRLELLRRWIDYLPSGVLEEHPELLYWRGECDRLLARFHEAVHWYTLAEGAFIQKGERLWRSRVYRGQAQIYLDTIQPVKALHWLQKAVQALGDEYPQETAQVLRLLAENHTNSGRLSEAEEMIKRADFLAPNTQRDELDIRVHLRTGRLLSARQMTLSIIDKEKRNERLGVRRNAKSHREMHLLLSLIDAFRGDWESAHFHAEQGIRRGQELQSPFVELVGYMRLGHAFVLNGRLTDAQDSYKRAISMSEDLDVERAKVEALMGMCSTSGLLGELEQAERMARKGLELALNVHDHWCANMIRLTLGSIYVAWGHYEDALPWLLTAEEGFVTCGDLFCLTNVRLWLSILYQRTGQVEAFNQATTLMLQGVEEGGYEQLFLKRTMFGPSDLQMTVPSLLQARDELKLESADRLLRKMGIGKGMTRHPGYTLRIYTLGHFTVYRGLEEVGRKEWKREKSRQLFQLFVSYFGQLLQREQIYELLWPDEDEKTANRDFKVAMNALANAIEPLREARSDSFFIERVDTAYRFNPHVVIWIDASEFRTLAEKGLTLTDSEQAIRELQAALQLYQGDFLQHHPYLDWCADERERIRTLYLRVLEKLAEHYIDQEAYQEAVSCCEKILAADPAWETAYQMLMTIYYHLGNRGLVIATYKKCVIEMEEQLGLSPMEETTALYQRLVRGNQMSTA